MWGGTLTIWFCCCPLLLHIQAPVSLQAEPQIILTLSYSTAPFPCHPVDIVLNPYFQDYNAIGMALLQSTHSMIPNSITGNAVSSAWMSHYDQTPPPADVHTPTSTQHQNSSQ